MWGIVWCEDFSHVVTIWDKQFIFFPHKCKGHLFSLCVPCRNSYPKSLMPCLKGRSKLMSMSLTKEMMETTFMSLNGRRWCSVVVHLCLVRFAVQGRCFTLRLVQPRQDWGPVNKLLRVCRLRPQPALLCLLLPWGLSTARTWVALSAIRWAVQDAFLNMLFASVREKSFPWHFIVIQIIQS